MRIIQNFGINLWQSGMRTTGAIITLALLAALLVAWILSDPLLRWKDKMSHWAKPSGPKPSPGGRRSPFSHHDASVSPLPARLFVRFAPEETLAVRVARVELANFHDWETHRSCRGWGIND